MRKRATRSGAWPCASKELPRAARRPAISRVTRAAVRAGSRASGSDQTRREAVADGGVAEVVEADAEAGGVGEVGVVLAGAGEVGEELDLLADGDGDEEGRVFVGEGAGVGLGLAAGADHGVVPGRARAGAAAGRAGEERELGRRRSGARRAWLRGRSGRACRGRCGRGCRCAGRSPGTRSCSRGACEGSGRSAPIRAIRSLRNDCAVESSLASASLQRAMKASGSAERHAGRVARDAAGGKRVFGGCF